MLKPLVLLVLSVPSSGFADEVLFTDGAWKLELLDYNDGTLGCSTSTTNDDGATFYFESWPDGSASVSLSDPDWQFPAESEDTSFGIRVNGGDVWVAEGGKYDQTVQAAIDFSNSSFDILMEMLTNGTSMEILSAKGTPITRFTLDGAAATLEYHFDCETRFPPP